MSALLKRPRAAANLFLAALPLEDRNRLRPLMHTVQLKYKQPIYKAGEAIQSVYFPITAVFSLISNLHDGTSTELGMIGGEGMVGLSAVLGSDSMPFDVMVQIAGTADEMSAATLTEEAGRQGPVGAGLLRYTQAFLNQIAQGVSCSRHHDIKQRLPRYLLMLCDRVQLTRLPLTHEFLGQMLGVGRPSVTIALDALQAAGLVRLSRGGVTITDRPGLEAAACECYQDVRGEDRRLLGWGEPTGSAASPS